MGNHVLMLFSKPWVHSMWVVHRVGMVGLQNQRFLICGSQYLIGLLLVKTDLLLTPCSDTTSTSCFNASYQTDQHRYQQILFCAIWKSRDIKSFTLGTNPKKHYKGKEMIIGFYPTNQNTLYLLCLFYSDKEIITVRGRRQTSNMHSHWLGSLQFNSLSGFCGTNQIMI